MSCEENLPFPCDNVVQFCDVVNSTLSTCKCVPGRIGVNCQELSTPLDAVLVFQSIFYTCVAFICAILFYRRIKITKGQDFQQAVLRGVTPNFSRIGPKMILVYRSLVFLFVLGVHISEYARLPGLYRL